MICFARKHNEDSISLANAGLLQYRLLGKAGVSDVLNIRTHERLTALSLRLIAKVKSPAVVEEDQDVSVPPFIIHDQSVPCTCWSCRNGEHCEHDREYWDSIADSSLDYEVERDALRREHEESLIRGVTLNGVVVSREDWDEEVNPSDVQNAEPIPPDESAYAFDDRHLESRWK